MSTILLFKLLLVPTLIAGITLAGRRWGPAVAGWLSAFPVVAGPILFFIAMEQGATFAADAAVGTLSALPAIVAFGLGYAWTATRFGWAGSLVSAFAAYLIDVAVVTMLAPGLAGSLSIAVITLAVAPRLFPVAPALQPATGKHVNDLLFRMVAAALLVFGVTHFASSLGAQLSGVLALFPVMSSVLVAFSHRNSGAPFAIHLLRGMVLGFISFAIFCTVLAVALPVLGTALSFGLAVAAAVVVQAFTRLTLQRPVTPRG
jgi:hypothetical protein